VWRPSPAGFVFRLIAGRRGAAEGTAADNGLAATVPFHQRTLCALADFAAAWLDAQQKELGRDDDWDPEDMLKGSFTLTDMRKQMSAMNRMGPLDQILDMIPGLGGGLMDQLPDDAMSVTGGTPDAAASSPGTCVRIIGPGLNPSFRFHSVGKKPGRIALTRTFLFAHSRPRFWVRFLIPALATE
jgi:hypothetical protein